METKQDLQASTELMIVEQTRSQAQTVMSLCPQFLKHELEINCYDNNLDKLLAVPIFRTPVRKIPDNSDREVKIDLLKASITRIEATLLPADTNQLKEVLGRLALHKGVGNYSEGQAIALINDYVRLLADCPYDLLCKACDECILDPHMQYFPQVGRIRDKMAREITLRQLYLGRLRKILELSQWKEERPMDVRPQELGASLADRFKP